jgi:hypothetical protein
MCRDVLISIWLNVLAQHELILPDAFKYLTTLSSASHHHPLNRIESDAKRLIELLKNPLIICF